MTSNKKESPLYIGHFKRLRERFFKDNGKTMHDYEIVEMLLHEIDTRHDVKPLAKTLLNKFHSFTHLLTAPYETLKKEGLADRYIFLFKLVVCASRRLSAQRLQESNEPVLAIIDQVIDYCRCTYAHEKIEKCGLIFLNSQYKVIHTDTIQEGTINRVAIYVREVIKNSLVNGASALIICHNHPNGNLDASIADLETTLNLIESTKNIHMKLIDHIIITEDDYFSFSENDLLNPNNLRDFIQLKLELEKNGLPTT